MRVFKRKTRDDGRLWADLRAYAEREGLTADDMAEGSGVDRTDCEAILADSGDRPRSAALTAFAKAWGIKPKRTEASRYTVEFYDEKNQLVRRLTGYTNKAASLDLGRRCEELSAYAAQRQQPTAELRQWLEGLPGATQARLLAFGLIDAQRFAGSRPLTELIDEYEAHLKAKGNKGFYPKQTADRVRKAFTAAGFVYWADIRPTPLQSALSKLRSGERLLKTQTRSHYLKACQWFANWMVKEGRAERSPLANVSAPKVVDASEYRALSDNELQRIVSAALDGPVWAAGGSEGMSGPDRALLYTVAAQTGLRASELGSLSRDSFELDTLPARVHLPGTATKNGHAVTIALHAETADWLRGHLTHKLPGVPLFNLPGYRASSGRRRVTGLAKMLKADAKRAGVDLVDAQGRKLVFHSLRHTFISALGRTGASIETVRTLARHSDLSTTQRYLHTSEGEQVAALESLTRLGTQVVQHKAVGTTDAKPGGGFPVVRKSVRNSAPGDDSQRPEATSANESQKETTERKHLQMKEKSSIVNENQAFSKSALVAQLDRASVSGTVQDAARDSTQTTKTNEVTAERKPEPVGDCPLSCPTEATLSDLERLIEGASWIGKAERRLILGQLRISHKRHIKASRD